MRDDAGAPTVARPLPKASIAGFPVLRSGYLMAGVPGPAQLDVQPLQQQVRATPASPLTSTCAVCVRGRGR